MQTYIHDNGFGPFFCDGVELVRRLFVTVRDEAWQETLPSSWISTVDDSSRMVRVEARHTTPTLDVEWLGSLTLGADDCSGSFEFEAVTRRSMRICRLGLVVLHPLDFMVGSSITARGPQGDHSVTIGPAIAPQPIVDGRPAGMTPGFSSLIVERDAIGRLRLDFEGDLFELEDQRNWGDASFKTYCTPLCVGFPRTLDADTRITQRLRWTFTPAATRVAPPRPPPFRAIRGTLPSLGRAWPEPRSQSPTPAWHHVNLDLRSDSVAIDKLEMIPAPALELSVSDQVPTSALAEFAARMAARRTRLARVLVYGAERPVPSMSEIIRWRRALEEVNLGHAPLLAATCGYFVEFNRGAFALPSVVDGIAFPYAGTIHSDDTASVIENVTTLRDIAATARSLIPGPTLGLAPLALYYPGSPASRTFPLHLIGPWLTAALLQSAAAGLDSVTLDEELVQALPGPLLDLLLHFEGSRVTLLLDEKHPRLHAAELIRRDDRRTLLAVNLDETPMSLPLDQCASCLDPAAIEHYRSLTPKGEFLLPPGSVRRLGRD
jgi:D-apionolactonase